MKYNNSGITFLILLILGCSAISTPQTAGSNPDGMRNTNTVGDYFNSDYFFSYSYFASADSVGSDFAVKFSTEDDQKNFKKLREYLSEKEDRLADLQDKLDEHVKLLDQIQDLFRYKDKHVHGLESLTR